MTDSRYTILVVEDDPDAAGYMRTVLERSGMDPHVVSNPQAALALLNSKTFDLILTDIELPGMTGLELTERVKKTRPDLPIVVMTAHATLDYAVNALRLQADEFLFKPIRKPQLVEVVTRLVEQARAAARPTNIVLAIGAHPDDVEIGVGGTLAAHQAAGDQIVILTMSRGARGGAVDNRQDESLAAAELIGARLFLNDLEDTRISAGDPTVGIIEQVVAEVHPTIVYTHSSNDRHQDHVAVHRAVSVATRRVPMFACYQSPSATVDFRPNRFVSIDGFTDTKLALLASFASQAGIRDYLAPDFVLATARYWSRYGGGVYAEPLEVVRDATGLRANATSQAVGHAATSLTTPTSTTSEAEGSVLDD
ncbi:GlcNAc-PI de-N-acetylase [Sanguibacter gelidistatuariae]|uniref:GlcNAc-PI de-N-acetylase n=1 Tax=Sanguibacter gelidistatuariae TaxID=1814289 RepID=A0A1G6H8T7_9MICO|nr:response regulator [Sanguibacter gelidistatuariae]SDB90365.1 GlcNAc-PI de-N-acetylase [Sanguibacter gelidistatuariae]